MILVARWRSPSKKFLCLFLFLFCFVSCSCASSFHGYQFVQSRFKFSFTFCVFVVSCMRIFNWNVFSCFCVWVFLLEIVINLFVILHFSIFLICYLFFGSLIIFFINLCNISLLASPRLVFMIRNEK